MKNMRHLRDDGWDWLPNPKCRKCKGEGQYDEPGTWAVKGKIEIVIFDTRCGCWDWRKK